MKNEVNRFCIGISQWFVARPAAIHSCDRRRLLTPHENLTPGLITAAK